jgi:hypothetical protein
MKGATMSECQYDETLEQSFPASDPPANSGTTGVGRPAKPSHARDVGERPTGTPTSDRHAAETAHQWEDEHTASPRP